MKAAIFFLKSVTINRYIHISRLIYRAKHDITWCHVRKCIIFILSKYKIIAFALTSLLLNKYSNIYYHILCSYSYLITPEIYSKIYPDIGPYSESLRVPQIFKFSRPSCRWSGLRMLISRVLQNRSLAPPPYKSSHRYQLMQHLSYSLIHMPLWLMCSWFYVYN